MVHAAQEIRAIWPYQQPDSALPLLRPTGAHATERGIGVRGATRFPVLLCEGPHATHCRALELSCSGIVVERGRELSERELRAGYRLELSLPEQKRPVRALAKVARVIAPGVYAFKFVHIADVDRLTLMEHLDRQRSEGLHLLEEIEQASSPRRAA